MMMMKTAWGKDPSSDCPDKAEAREYIAKQWRAIKSNEEQ